MSTWDDRFMQLAQTVASWSKDPSTKVGAVIVDYDRRIIGTGYNGFPRGVHDDIGRYQEKQVKYRMIVHSEANAILNAVKSVRDHTIYTTKFPCSECTKLIIQSGLTIVVTPKPDTEGIWGEDAKYSLQMLKEAGLIIRYYEGDLT